MSERLKLNLHFGGGAELLFNNIKKREVELPPLARYSADGWMTEKWTVKELLVWIKENLLRKRPELFLQGDSVGPDIDVQINDIPLELCGELDYELQENDTVMFMFTSHRGKIWH